MPVPPNSQRWAAYAHHLGDYMHRWILRTPWGTLRLHHILRSDDDRHLHDHPFDFTSFLLTGGYLEITDTFSNPRVRPMAKCKACQAEIIWATSTNGKATPITAAVNPQGNIVLVDADDPRDPPLAQVVHLKDHTELPRHLNHFVDCPNAAQFRKAK